MSAVDILAKYPASRDVAIQGLSEPEYAEWQRRTGRKAVEFRGRFWEQVYPGFYATLPSFARMTTEQAQRPTRLSWGFRATLEDSDSDVADGFVTVHLIRDLSGYGEHSLQPRKRRALRSCLQRVTVVQLTDASVLCAQGYEVYLSYAARLGVRRPFSPAEYLRMVSQWYEDPRILVMAGILDGRLLGFIQSVAVGSTAYLSKIYVASSALPTNVNAALYYETLMAYKRSGVACEACSGLRRPENPGISSFKEQMGFELVKMPVRFRAPRVVTAYLRRRRPYEYYRLGGGP